MEVPVEVTSVEGFTSSISSKKASTASISSMEASISSIPSMETSIKAIVEDTSVKAPILSAEASIFLLKLPWKLSRKLLP